MKKRTTRIGLGAAVLVAAGSVAAGAAASANAMPTPPKSEVVSATVLQVSSDGKVISCEVEGDLAAKALPVTVSGSAEVQVGKTTAAAGGSGATSTSDISGPVEVQAEPADGGFVFGTTGPDGKVIAKGGPDDIRTGTPEECSPITDLAKTGQ